MRETIYEVHESRLTKKKDECLGACATRTNRLGEAVDAAFILGKFPEQIKITNQCVRELSELCQIQINRK